MKRILILSVMMLMVLGFSMQAHAALQNLGVDDAGNRLIYDTDLDITWYDYTNAGPVTLFGDTWQKQMDWADALSVTFGSNTYTDWRLPITFDQIQTEGCIGFYCTNSEMGHLFFTELKNVGRYDTSGNPTGCFLDCLTNTGAFKNLREDGYWSETEALHPAGYSVGAWYFFNAAGYQDFQNWDAPLYGIAVRPGLAAVPEPTSLLLLGSGLVGVMGLKWRKRL